MDQHYMEILFEEMRGRFDLVLEGHAALRAELHEFRRESHEKHDLTALRIGALKDRIDTVEQSLSTRIDTVEQNLSARIDTVEKNLSARIDSVEKNLDAVAIDLSAHRADTEAHRNYLVRE
jgi:hypothetical protein